MLPIFGSADPIALSETSSYRFHGFILMRPGVDKKFVEEINGQYKKWHKDTGSQFVICTFLPPPKAWLERYSQWWIANYSGANSSADIAVLSELLKDRNYKIDKEFFNDFVSISVDLFGHSLLQQNNIASIFNLTDNDFPAFIVFDKSTHTLSVFRSVDVFKISCLIHAVVTNNSLPKSNPVTLTLEDEKKLFNAISHSRENFHDSFAEASFFLVSRRIAEEQSQSGIKNLTERFPEFQNLENPEHFSWAKSLLKGLDRYTPLLTTYIKQINLLDNGGDHPSLDLKTISNPKFPASGKVRRFRINEKYRAWFFVKDGRRIHFFLGDHDYGIR
jgi:hypothetical protein